MGWIVLPHGKVLAIEGKKIRSDDGRKGRFYKGFSFILACTEHPTEEIYFYLDSAKVVERSKKSAAHFTKFGWN